MASCIGCVLRLNAPQKRRLRAALKRGAVAVGYDSDLWTCQRVRDVIGRTEGVWYDFNHVGRILHALGFCVQKPESRARERDEGAIACWRKRDWPRIKRRAAAERYRRVLRRIRLHAASAGASDLVPPGCHFMSRWHRAGPTPQSVQGISEMGSQRSSSWIKTT